MAVILVTAKAFRRHGERHMEALRAEGHTLHPSPVWVPMSESELLDLLTKDRLGERIEGVIAGSDRYTASVLDAMPRLRVIARWGIGYDAIDVDAATERGIVVANTPGLLGDALADLAFGFMIALARQIVRADKLVRHGGWEELSGVSVWRKSLGIVGFGSGGQALARRARGFEMTIRAYDPYAEPDVAKALGVALVPFETLLAESDFISLHASLNESTRGMFDREAFAQMKPGAFLINTARGGLIDEAALIDALESRRLAGVALDAHAEEPPPPNHPLFAREDVILTPHIGFSTKEGIDAVNVAVLENLRVGLEGGVPKCAVNPEAVTRRIG